MKQQNQQKANPKSVFLTPLKPPAPMTESVGLLGANCSTKPGRFHQGLSHVPDTDYCNCLLLLFENTWLIILQWELN